MLRGASLDSAVTDVMNPHPVVGAAPLARDEAVALMQRRSLRHLPLVDAKRCLVDVLFLDELLRPTLLPNAAVIMAGGAGRRLAPLTETTPKPLLKVGGKPLLEIMIERLRDAGVREVLITVHYKSEMIEAHVGDGARLGVRVRYVHETRALGTAGSLRQMGAGDVTHALFEEGYRYVRRQDAPAVYQPSGAVYVTRYDVLMGQGRVLGKDNRGIVMDFAASVNIDTEWDFLLAELVLGQGRAPIPPSRR